MEHQSLEILGRGGLPIGTVEIRPSTPASSNASRAADS